MARSIRRLAPETASRIAAGEVIERPLSALKETLENAIDAGARSIEIRVEGSLDRRFQIADDGVGIAAGDLELALERHATSKIESLEDLDRLASLGFRGEALPSIAAVSRLSITSRTVETSGASRIASEAGRVLEREDTARAIGTTVEVADLFFNTPARRKFLRSAAGELRAAIRMFECYALAYPGVGFRLLVDERERFDWPPVRSDEAASANGDADVRLAARRERAAALWGARHASQLVAAAGERDGIRVEALLGLPEHARATREGQVFLIQGRWVQNPSLGQALRQAYGNLLPHGRFPSATLWITVPAGDLDVNVHPTKREVRFADDGAVFALVAGVCAKALAHLQPPFSVVRGGQEQEPRWADRVRERPADPAQLGLGIVGAAPTRDGAAASLAGSVPAAHSSAAAESEPELWQLHRTYILAPVRGGLVIIDQHAAHERILYEVAKARMVGERGTSQQLLFPALIDLTRSQFELVVEAGPWLHRLGWDLAPLGPPSVVIQGVPSDLKHEHPGQMLQDILDGMSDAGRGGGEGDDIAEQLARSHACHAAVRAGDPLTQQEMKALVDRLFATSVPHGDPHGRVTFVRLDLDELHRRFGRA